MFEPLRADAPVQSGKGLIFERCQVLAAGGRSATQNPGADQGMIQVIHPGPGPLIAQGQSAAEQLEGVSALGWPLLEEVSDLAPHHLD